MAPLDALKPKEQPLACVLPCKGPLDSSPQGMDGCIEQPLAPPLGGLAMARIFLNVRNHSGIEDRLSIRLRIELAIEIELRIFQHQSRELGYPRERFETLWYEHHIRFVDRCNQKRRDHIASVVYNGHDFVALLVFVA